MPATYEEAIDQMSAFFKVAWDANTTAIVGYVPEVFWPGVEKENAPDVAKYWARFTQEGVNEEQTTLTGDAGCQRFTPEGLIVIQVFCPKLDSVSMENGRKLATVGKEAYRGKKTSGGIWFRNVKIKELTPEAKWNRFNVIAEYEYDEIG